LSEDSRHWLAGLRDAVATARRAAGSAGQIDASPGQVRAERAILSAHLVTWLDNELPTLLGDRERDDDPAIVITTSPVGIVVVDETLRRDEPLMRSLRDRIVAVTEREYREWTKDHPDPDHRLHINHWSWIKLRVPEARRHAFAAYPLSSGEQHWLHRTGTSGCGRERRFCHLWKWNGSNAALVKPFFPETIRRL
jgi:hypothetical protein